MSADFWAILGVGLLFILLVIVLLSLGEDDSNDGY